MSELNRSAVLNACARGAAVVALAILVRGSLQRTASALARDESLAAAASETLVLLLLCLALSYAVAVYRRRPLPLPFAPALAISAAAAIAYGAQLDAARSPGLPLPSVGFAPAGSTQQENHPARPRVLYHYNRHGFRGPDWEFESPGPRICVLGDSYVFGSGVAWDDTLGEALRRRLPAYEVLNLGVPGHNMRSHVAMYGFAAGRLECDQMVLAIVIPNDLSRFDINSEIVLKSTISAYSAVEFFFGPQLPARIWNTRELAQSTGPDEVEELKRQWSLLAAKRARHGTTPLYVFTYADDETLTDRAQLAQPAQPAQLAQLEGVTILPKAAYDPSLYIAGDGHPNAKGNEFFAARLARAMQR